MSAPATINAFDAGFTPKQITDEILAHFRLRLDAPDDDPRVVHGLGFGEDVWTTGTHMLLERMPSREVYTALAPILLCLWGGEGDDVQQGFSDIIEQLELCTKDGSGMSSVDFVRFTEPDVWQSLTGTSAVDVHWGTFTDLLGLSDVEEDDEGPSPATVRALLVHLDEYAKHFPYKEVAEELATAKEDVAQAVLEWMLGAQGRMQHVDGARIVVREQGVMNEAERAGWMNTIIRSMVRVAIAAGAPTLARVARLVTIARRAFGVSEIARRGFTLLIFVLGELTANTGALSPVDAYVPLFAALTLVICQSRDGTEDTDQTTARMIDTTERATRAPFVHQRLLCQMVHRRRAWLKVRESALLPSATGQRGPEYARRSRSRLAHAEQEAQRQASSLRAAHDLYAARMARYEAEMSQVRRAAQPGHFTSYAVPPPQYPIFEHAPPQPREYTAVPLLPREYQAQREALQEAVERVLPEVKRLPLEIEADIMALVMDLPDAAERRDLALIMRDHEGAAHDPTLGKRKEEEHKDDSDSDVFNDMLDTDVFGDAAAASSSSSKRARR
ncbi:MAG: hypothetical protein Q7V62_16920 [Actinomycetota bacterium]|nr:hypothetical protein [Actinomycetota bacterium]